MSGEEFGESGEFGDEVSEMLHRQARAHPDHPDPVTMTREHVRVARARRHKAGLSAAAVTAVVATVGVVWGTTAVAGGGGGGPASVGAVGGNGTSTPTARSPHTTAHPVPSVSSSHSSDPSQGAPGSASAPSSMPSTEPTGDGVVRGCDPHAVLTMTAKNFAWPARGTLAADATLGDTLVQRATALTGGHNAKLAYAGENAATRVAVVFVDPPDDSPCGPGLRAVVFHGAQGTAPDQLAVQIGEGHYGAQLGFQWSERNADGSLSLLLIEPPTVRTLKGSGTLGTKAFNGYTTVPAANGSLLTTYPAGASVPSIFDFTDPATSLQGAEHVAPVVTAPTAEALAAALATDPTKLTPIDRSQHLGIAFKIGANGPRFALRPTDVVAGAETVYWSDFT